VTTYVNECVHEKVPYTVCKKVPYTVTKQVPYTVTRHVRETVVERVPYTVTRYQTEVVRSTRQYTTARVACGAYMDVAPGASVPSRVSYAPGTGTPPATLPLTAGAGSAPIVGSTPSCGPQYHAEDGPGRVFVEGASYEYTTTSTSTRMVQETRTRRVPYTTYETVQETHYKKVPYTVCHMVPHTTKRMVPYKTCEMVTETHCRKVPVTTCHMETYTTCHRVPVTVCKQVPYTYTVKVPYCVQECVPCTVTKRVPVCACKEVCVWRLHRDNCNSCSNGCNRGLLSKFFGSRMCCESCSHPSCK
jgi:hypothetical protein